jgi:hypothetical protein
VAIETRQCRFIQEPYFYFILFYLICLFIAVLGFELRAFTLSHSTSPIFVKSFFKIGSQELFAQAGFELQSSISAS